MEWRSAIVRFNADVIRFAGELSSSGAAASSAFSSRNARPDWRVLHPIVPSIRARRVYDSFMQSSLSWLRPLSRLLLGVVAMLLFPGCNAINPLCGSARPAPTISSLSPATIQFSQVQQSTVLTVNGSEFVSASVVVINGTVLPTTVVSNQQLQVTITTELISGPGTANVAVNTPSGNSGDLGCTSGGTSGSLVLTIT
jgi:hypothetical protein